MDAPTDPAKLRAALEHLEAVQAQRLAEKIAAGEINNVALYIVAGSHAEARIRVEQAKADKLAEFHAAGDRREVVFRVDTVVTGVRQHGEVADPASVPSAPSFLSPEDRAIKPPLPSPPVRAAADFVEEEAAEEPQPPVIETYVCVQTRRCEDEDDPGEIAEGWFSIDGKVVTVTDANGKCVGSRTMLKDEDARVVAKALLREKSPESESFNRVLHYPNVGLA
jgi:hypothetical protein